MVLVKNPTKRPITVVITHADAPKTDVAFHQQLHDAKTGDIAERRVDLRLPESVTLLGGEERELPPYAKREALAAGLEVVRREEPKDEPADAQKRSAPKRDEGTPDAEADRSDKSGRGGDQNAEGLPNALKRKRGAE